MVHRRGRDGNVSSSDDNASREALKTRNTGSWVDARELEVCGNPDSHTMVLS